VDRSQGEILHDIDVLLDEARATGRSEGYRQAQRDFYGQNAAYLMANSLADAMEAMASRIQRHDPTFAGFLQRAAAQFREAVARPSIEEHSPVEGETNVPADAPITARFNVDMDESTLTPENFRVAPASGGAALEAEVAYDGASRVATLTPNNGFSSEVAYTVTLENVRSTSGVGFDAAYTWGFTAE
jgi:hypothetical protein